MRWTWCESRLFSHPSNGAELERPHPALGLAGQGDQHRVVLVRQTRVGRQLPCQLAVEAHLHHLQGAPRPCLARIEPACLAHEEREMEVGRTGIVDTSTLLVDMSTTTFTEIRHHDNCYRSQHRHRHLCDRPSHSRIGFVARHAMVTKVRGSFNEFEGTGYFDADQPANSHSSW